MNRQFDIYIVKTGNNTNDIIVGSETISTTELQDLLNESKNIKFVNEKPSLTIEPGTKLELNDGNTIVPYDTLKLSFDSIYLTKTELAFLKALLIDGNVDVMYYDPIKSDILIGCRDTILDLNIATISNEFNLIHIAGTTNNNDINKKLIYYSITMNSIRINHPRNGYLYFSMINNVMGV